MKNHEKINFPEKNFSVRARRTWERPGQSASARCTTEDNKGNRCANRIGAVQEWLSISFLGRLAEFVGNPDHGVGGQRVVPRLHDALCVNHLSHIAESAEDVVTIQGNA